MEGALKVGLICLTAGWGQFEAPHTLVLFSPMGIIRPSGLEIIGFPSYVSIEAVACGLRHICGEMVWVKGNTGRHACLAVSDTPQRR